MIKVIVKRISGLIVCLVVAAIISIMSGCPQNSIIIDVFKGNAVWDESAFDSEAASFSP
jgi:hypothetical protein